MPPAPTVTDVEHITAITDPIIRNLQITQSYHELALAVSDRTGLSANWCTFATWASKQAGQTIRKDDLARMLDSILQPAPAPQALPTVVATAQALGSPHSEDDIQESVTEVLNPLVAFDRASQAVARGNQKVYAEIGREFARFIATCLHDTVYDEASITRFCAQLSPGDPPDGQRYLRQAFTRYYQVIFESNPNTRAQLLLLANIEIGLHEQTRLQPEIAAAMDAAFGDPRQYRVRLIKALFPHRGWMVRLQLFLLHLFNRPSPFDAALNALIAEARRQAHLLISEYVMVIDLPHNLRLRLGADIPAAFPPSLQHLDLPDLRALLDTIDPTPDSTHDSGTVDWAHLPDRLHFIVDMFRCYHEMTELFDPPFTPEQVAAFRAGRLPSGKL